MEMEHTFCLRLCVHTALNTRTHTYPCQTQTHARPTSNNAIPRPTKVVTCSVANQQVLIKGLLLLRVCNGIIHYGMYYDMGSGGHANEWFDVADH